jgi:hypothetical protein
MKVTPEALAVSKAVRDGGGKAEEWLRDKCNWEQRSRTSIIMEYGDPRNCTCAGGHPGVCHDCFQPNCPLHLRICKCMAGKKESPDAAMSHILHNRPL